MRILVTGGAGFIGSTLIHRLVEDNEIVVLDTLTRDSMQYWPQLSSHPHLELRQGSVLDPIAVADAMAGVDLVVHCAGIAGIYTVVQKPTQTLAVNALGTWNVLEAARKTSGVERFIEFSTSEIFGAEARNVTETDPAMVGAVGEPRWTYAVSKLAAEHMAHAFHREFGLPTVTLRPFNVYGPRQVGEGAIHHFIVKALAGEALTVHNDGAQVRAWCYVDDMVDAILLALYRDEAVGQAFNIGNDRTTGTILQLAEQISELAGGVPIERVPRAGADVLHRSLCLDKARKLLGFEPKVELDEGLAKTLRWYRNRSDEEAA